jgi:hypothetical protein
METQIKAYESDTINIQSHERGEVIFSIWKIGAHATTYLAQDQIKQLIAELSQFLEDSNV